MSYDLLLQKAVELHNQGNFDEAEVLYRQILEAMPENPDILNLLGMVAQSKNAHNQAIELFYSAQKKSPDNKMYAFNLGFSLLQLGKFSEAEASFSKAFSLSADFKEAVYYIGVCAEKKGEISKAERYYNHALEIDPLYFEAKLALCLMSDNIDKLLALDKEYTDNYLIKANISKKYFDCGNLEKALSYAEKSYILNPYDDEISAFYGALLLENRETGKALQVFDNALKINNHNVQSLINSANILSSQKREEEAEKRYRQALDIEPKNFDAHLNLATLLFNQNRKAEALDEYREASIINPKSSELSLNLASLLKSEEEYEEALGLLFNAQNQNDNPEISINIAETITLLADKNRDLALKIAENWVRSMPNNLFAKHTLSALNGEKIDDNKAYSEQLFDTFADNYNDILQKIEYRAPQYIAELTKNISGTIIDLGCGSGLVAEASLNHKQKYIGVDISAKMLKQAQKTGKYAQLIKSDIIAYLKTKPEADLLICADVLCYLSDLSEFFSLSKGYKLCFSLEALENSDDEYLLLTSGRYAHSKKYIENQLDKNNFQNIKFYERIIRTENGHPIKGYIFTACF